MDRLGWQVWVGCLWAVMLGVSAHAQDSQADSTANRAAEHQDSVVWSYETLASRLVDLKHLAVPPMVGEQSGAFTSRDWASRFDAASGKYVDWRANRDGDGFVREADNGDGIVAVELEGPGVIWRIWSASPQDGPIRFYIDGADEPVLALPFKQLFDAKHGPFRFDQLVGEWARGWNCYVPIAFNESIRIELGEGWGKYHQFTYTTFPKHVSVPSFTGQLHASEREALAKVNQAWAYREQGQACSSESQIPGSDLAQTIENTVTIAPGETATLAKLPGAGAITNVEITVDASGPETQQTMLRELAVSMHWDGEAAPSVWSPLGDFFGSAPGIHPFETLVSGMAGQTLRSGWYMPFANGAHVQITNDGQQPRTLSYALSHEPLQTDANNLLRFHAKWHRDDTKGMADWGEDRYPDWLVLDVEGAQGRFCGMHLHAWNPLHKWDEALSSKYEQPTSEKTTDDDWFQSEVVGNRYWYGEGDEKFFVDGETMPSTFGTGTEDYFGFAWGTPQLFDSGLQAQTVNTNNTNHISLLRHQIPDNVPFQTSFQASIEKYHGNNWPLLYAVTAYWYQAPGSAPALGSDQTVSPDRYGPVPVSERLGYFKQPTLRQPKAAADGWYEGETDLIPSPESQGQARVQTMAFAGPHWRGDAHLLWEGAIGEEAELQFAIDQPFEGVIEVQLTQAPDYGRFVVTLDGMKRVPTVGDYTVDLYDPAVKPAPLIKSIPVQLDAGVHRICFELTGANPAAKTFGDGHHLLGVDWIRLVPKH